MLTSSLRLGGCTILRLLARLRARRVRGWRLDERHLAPPTRRVDHTQTFECELRHAVKSCAPRPPLRKKRTVPQLPNILQPGDLAATVPLTSRMGDASLVSLPQTLTPADRHEADSDRLV